jgi:hypothetical protein
MNEYYRYGDYEFSRTNDSVWECRTLKEEGIDFFSPQGALNIEESEYYSEYTFRYKKAINAFREFLIANPELLV